MSKTASTKAARPQIKPAPLAAFHHALAKWYKTHGRHALPWRNTADPYHIWLSEVMLQQTQVATVESRFYAPFLAKFPTIQALATASPEAVMKAWEGLGYYSRARNLHAAAKQISTMPKQLDALIALPGIGRNTASAILAFAYHQPVAILEANVKRLVARIFALETPSDNELWSGAEALLNHAAPFDHNQAMMDIGSTVCTPKKPNCPACPANVICKGKHAPERYPARKVKKQTPTREVIIHVREDAGGKLYLEPREAKLLGGLYGFPQTPRAASSSGSSRGSNFKMDSRHKAENDVCLGTVTHVYSHFKLIGHVVHERLASRSNSPHWHTRAGIAALPLSKLDHKVLALVEACNTGQKKRAKASPARAKR